MAWFATGVAPLDPTELARARQYLYGGLVGSTVAQLWLLAALAGAYFSGASAWARQRLERRFASRWLVQGGVAAGLGVGVQLLLLPFDFYLDYVRERAFGFQHQTALAWLGQWGLSALVTLVALVVVVELAYAALGGRGLGAWWLRMWGVVAVGVVFAAAIQPVLIAPLFNRFTPVGDPAVSAALGQLARRAGIPHAEILEVNASRQSSHTNAYVFGLLGTERIVVYDTLLRDQPLPEVEFVVGHEIGHYVLDHLAWGVAFTLLFLLGLFALLGWLYPRLARGPQPGDVAGLPLLLLLLFLMLFLAAPVTNGFSRWEEHQADAYGLQLSGQGCAAVASFQREEHTDLIYPDPPAWMVAWFFTHPSQQQRIDFARRFCRP